MAAPLDWSPIPGFTFGDPDAPAPTLDDRERPATLDERGEATMDLPLPPAGSSGLARHLTFLVDVIDASGRAVCASASCDATPSGARIGVAALDGTALDGTALDGTAIDGTVVDRTVVDRPVVAIDVVTAGGSVERALAVLSRVEWVGGYVVERRRRVWRSERTETVVEKIELALANGKGRVTFHDPGDGSFVVRVSSKAAAPAALKLERVGGRTRRSTSADGAPRLALAIEGSARPGARASRFSSTPRSRDVRCSDSRVPASSRTGASTSRWVGLGSSSTFPWTPFLPFTPS